MASSDIQCHSQSKLKLYLKFRVMEITQKAVYLWQHPQFMKWQKKMNWIIQIQLALHLRKILFYKTGIHGYVKLQIYFSYQMKICAASHLCQMVTAHHLLPFPFTVWYLLDHSVPNQREIKPAYISSVVTSLVFMTEVWMNYFLY